jgi:hypothetical protein
VVLGGLYLESDGRVPFYFHSGVPTIGINHLNQSCLLKLTFVGTGKATAAATRMNRRESLNWTMLNEEK